MKTIKDHLTFPILLLVILTISIQSCSTDDTTPPASTKKIPVLWTTNVTSVTETTAESGGTITDDGGKTVTARGVCWSTAINPTIDNSKTTDGTGAGNYASSVTGLTPGTTYYLRAYATNSDGTGYGSAMSFTTTPSGTGEVKDIDGNVYTKITIGTQVWLAENLRTTKLNDGTSIPLVSNSTLWGGLTTPAYCYYNSDLTNKDIYGFLYNWYTVNSGKLAPTGWHVATDADWTVLETYLATNTGGKLKEAGTAHWQSPNTGATNETGFTALPGGSRYYSGNFLMINQYGGWWTSTEYDASNATFRCMQFDQGSVNKAAAFKMMGLSVRCVKN
jgi:uncharacterized protein (TIGR02145 family)